MNTMADAYNGTVKNGRRREPGKPDSLTVLPIGCRVAFKDGGQEGTVTGMTIRDGNNVRYEVVFWTSSGRVEVWAETLELEPLSDNAERRIGFIGRA